MDAEVGRIDCFCPRCNIHVEAKVLACHHYEKSVIHEDFFDPTDRQYTEDVFTFATCIRCNRPLLVRESHHIIEGNSIPQGEVCRVYPPDEVVPDAVPDTVARPYREARQAYKVKLYDSCVTMCRKTLEAVCGHYGESQDVLSRRLDRLLQQGVIDKAMFDWAQELRLSGNRAAHAGSEAVLAAEARDMLEFARAMLLYAFELPKRLRSSRLRRTA